MRVVLPVRGSTGDLRPSLAVGVAMRQRGHEVVVVSHLNYQATVEQAGLDFRALDDAGESEAFEAAASLLQEARGGAEFWRSHVVPGLKRETGILLELCRSAPSLLLLQPVYDMAGRFAAELLDLPTSWLFISPAMLNGLPMRVGLVEELKPQLNQVRGALELPPIRDVPSWLGYAPENVGLWPEWFAPELQRPDVTPVGFPPVSAGPPGPTSRVLISGSTGRFLSGSLFEVAAAACARLRLPALVMSSFPDLLPVELPPDVEVTGFQPHHLVMPQASAVIHHGGIGTTLSAIAHGRPQLILAAGADRPDNGLRIQNLELGRCLLSSRWTRSDVAAALHDVLSSPIVSKKTAEYQHRLLQGGNQKLMVELLERAARTPWKPDQKAAVGLAALSPERRKLAEKLLRQRRQQAPTPSPEGPQPATPAQQRIWLAQQLDPNSSAFHKVHALRLRGPLDQARLEQALQAVLQRHQVLRTNLRWVEKDLLEVPGGGSEPWIHTDLCSLEPTLHWEQIQRFGQDLVARPYDLARGPLLRSHLVRLAEHEHFLLVGLHAAVSDAASTEVLWRDLGGYYERPETAIETVSYGGYARTLQASLQVDQLVAWWRNQLAGLVESEPPLARPRPERLSSAGAGYLLTLPKATLSPLESLARSQGVTLFVLLLAAFQALLQRYTDELDVVVGTRAAGRDQPQTLPLIGPLANTLVLRTRADGDPTFLEWIQRVAVMWRETQAHQALPFQTLVEALQPSRQANRHPFFSVLFYLQGQPLESFSWGDLEARQVLLKRGTAGDDLALSCRVVNEQLRCMFEYRCDLYSEETIQTLGQDWTCLLEAVCLDPQTPLSRLPPHQRRRESRAATRTSAPLLLNGPPQNELETQLAALYARHLGLSEVQRYDNFFRLGGHSMLAARLLVDLEDQIGRKLTLNTLFESPTVAELARFLEQERAPQALVLLQKGEGDLHVILVHPASGSISIYQRLLEHLGPQPNVYGLQALWEGNVPRHRTLHAMADHYAEQVRGLPGPCVLAGLSLGARIALQVAHRLPAGKVRRVVLLDGWGPGYPRFPNLWVRLKVHLGRALRLPAGQRLEYLRVRLRALGELLQRKLRSRMHRIRPGLDFVGFFSPGVTQAPPIRYEGSVLLVRALEQPVACLPDPRLGWTQQLLPDLETVEVPGYHGFMMHDPNVAEVARVLKAQL